MGRSPRGGGPGGYGGLPLFFNGAGYPTSRLTRSRSLQPSPNQSPRRFFAAGPRGGSMRLLRLLVMCGVSLLGVSLLYVQLVAAGNVFRYSSSAAAAEEAGEALPGSGPASASDADAATTTTTTTTTTAAAAPPRQRQRQLHDDPAAAAGSAALREKGGVGGTPSAAAAAAGGGSVAPGGSGGGGDAEESHPAPELDHLVLVAGHAVYTGLDFAAAKQEASWLLEPYQQVPGEAASFLDHIQLGIQVAAADPAALLLFSGGQTRRAAGPRSEGLSYWLVAEAAGWWGHTGVRGRAYTEEHARDSFENLMFSLCRFYEITGHYPSKITAVSYTLKQRRFEEVHRAALRFPAAAFRFVGTPIPPAAKGAQAGEAATVAAFLRDPYGCSGTLLAKKARRDPFAVGAPHPSRCPAMAGLLGYCGAKTYSGPVPWGVPAAGKAAGAGAGAAGARAHAEQAREQGLLKGKGRLSSRAGLYT